MQFSLLAPFTAPLLYTICCCRYYPLYTRALNRAVKGNRALLLLLPPDVVDSVKVWGGGGVWLGCVCASLPPIA